MLMEQVAVSNIANVGVWGLDGLSQLLIKYLLFVHLI